MDEEQRFAICGYATVYLYYAYPNKTRPRISQFLILPPFQRMGLGAKLLNEVYRSFYKDSNILDITGTNFVLRLSYFIFLSFSFYYFIDSQWKIHQMISFDLGIM